MEIRTDPESVSGYTNLITVTTQAGAGRKIIAGTVFDGVPRVVEPLGRDERSAANQPGARPGRHVVPA